MLDTLPPLPPAPTVDRRTILLIMLDTGAAEETVRKYLRGTPIRGHWLRMRLGESAAKHGAKVATAGPGVASAQVNEGAPLRVGAVG